MPRQNRRSYGTGALYERKNADGSVSWVGQWMDGGVRRKQTFGRKSRDFTKRKAEAALRKAIGSDRAKPEERRTLRQVWEAHKRILRDDKGAKPSTIHGYRSVAEAHIFPALGDRSVDRITQKDINEFAERLRDKEVRRGQKPSAADQDGRHGKKLSPATRRQVLGLLGALLKTARKKQWLTHELEIEKPKTTKPAAIEVFDAEEVRALARKAESEQDAAIFLTAALTGLRRGELLALRWRDVDFDGSAIRVERSFAGGDLTTPKSGKVRSVPMAPEVAVALAKLGQREHFTGDDNLVFAGTLGGYLDGSALHRRYDAAVKRAGLRPLRFHDLRHTFGTRMISRADIKQVQFWMGHADIQTTAGYLHFKSRESDAQLVADAFAPAPLPEPEPAEPVA